MAITPEEYDSCLTQEEADALPAGTMIWFKNVQHPLLLEKISVAKGQRSKAWKNSITPHACLSDFFESWLYNVGREEHQQKVWLKEEE